MADPFRSARLIYRAVEDDAEDSKLLHAITLDTVGFYNSNTKLVKPQSKKDTWQWKLHLENAMICVIICLPRKREALWFNGKWHDELESSILEHEWRGRQKEAGRKV